MTKPFIIIGLSGLAGAGKDTVADLLVTHCGFRKLAFADALRNEISDAFQMEPLYLSHRDTKEHPMSALALNRCQNDGFVGRMIIDEGERNNKLDLAAPRSPRQILQWWGTDYRRKQSPSYWTSQIGLRIHHLSAEKTSGRFVITDCRFDNEADLVRRHGGVLWQITRPGVNAPAAGHVSDNSGDDFQPDAVLKNSGDILHLQALTLGAFLMHDIGLSAHDIARMGLAHTAQATAEFHARITKETV